MRSPEQPRMGMRAATSGWANRLPGKERLARLLELGWQRLVLPLRIACRWPISPRSRVCAPDQPMVERPWLVRWWQAAPPEGDLAAIRARGAEIARRTLGDALWRQFCAQGYLDLRSPHIPGLTYRLRVGRRIELRWDRPDDARLIPWPARGYLCIQPTYPLPAIEFFAQLYLYLRDQEAEVIRVAIPQAADAPIRRVF
ncbi:MAG TPA: hypothetical protein VKY56_01835 [Chloroflexota bacterium]|nr:hypothetical protein [Chloroflexota bacterium]